MTRRLPLLLGVLVAAGCGSGGEGGTTSVASTTGPATATTTPTTAPERTAFLVYRVHDGKLAPERVRVDATRAVAAAALRELGVDAGVSVAGGTATVRATDLTEAEVAEVVYTLTGFPAITRVALAGRGTLTRDDVAKFAPPIIVEFPLPGDRFSFTRDTVRGTASVFEATLTVEIRQHGDVLFSKVLSASEGAPGRGTFDARVEGINRAPQTGPGEIAAYTHSAANGAVQHEVVVPVELTP